MDYLIRTLTSEDLDAVAAIYAAHTAATPPATWRARLSSLLTGSGATVALVAALPATDGVAGGSDQGADQVIGYLVGEVRSWEFGSPPAGWIFALAVAREHQDRGVARRLATEAVQRFRALGVSTLRTMVRRDDVDVLRFFRGAGYVAGPYTELELDLENL